MKAEEGRSLGHRGVGIKDLLAVNPTWPSAAAKQRAEKGKGKWHWMWGESVRQETEEKGADSDSLQTTVNKRGSLTTISLQKEKQYWKSSRLDICVWVQYTFPFSIFLKPFLGAVTKC